MSVHEIKPKQLRALLLLLVLVPFIPLVLVLRFMVDALESEKIVALERTAKVYQQALSNAQNSLEKHLAESGTSADAESVRAFFRDLFAEEIAVWLIENSGQPLGSEPKPYGPLVAQTSLKSVGKPWQVQLYLVDASALNDSVRNQFRTYAWTAGIAAISICVIAAGAGIAVSRQLRIQELKNTSV